MNSATARLKSKPSRPRGKPAVQKETRAPAPVPARATATNDGRLGILARKTKSLRTAARLTLQELSAVSGVSQSALSKIENGQLSPTYEKILALAKGLGVDVAELFSDSTSGTPIGRRAVTLKGRGVVHSSPQYEYQVLCSELSGKQFLPLLATIKAHSVHDFVTLPKHDGEEFVYVVRGEITLHTEFYEPIVLSEGDCCYFDSSMRHGLVSGGKEDAVVVWVCSKNVSLRPRETP
ncbi:helix-turn-helix domain-containing protein [Caenimonas soli]|uniref:helix-turn-helix domain-containing protein n=1 Tax=Caenimonas soli TaxID=2735555 RepID=UPI001553074B|nr:helix-turn-helix domain-containing protein [Caenimonas soli]NPC55344.1 helix-turn-helix domain-containing protein [Caenimonas soli]